MACGSCGGAPRRAGTTRGGMTSADATMANLAAMGEPLAVFAAGEELVVPEGATYVVYDAPGGTAYFGGHGAAFAWQQVQGGGRTRTV